MGKQSEDRGCNSLRRLSLLKQPERWAMKKEIYEKFRKKHSLPDYETVNSELEISDIESEDFFLRKVCKKIAERVEAASSLIGSLLQPSAESIEDMHECKFFSEKDKKAMIDAYKKLMILDRTGIEAGLERSEKNDAELISAFFSQWPGLKKEILGFVGTMKSCWEKETEIEEKLEYFV